VIRTKSFPRRKAFANTCYSANDQGRFNSDLSACRISRKALHLIKDGE
jgi:hypothetical protein